jgi:hypothetical protein
MGRVGIKGGFMGVGVGIGFSSNPASFWSCRNLEKKASASACVFSDCSIGTNPEGGATAVFGERKYFPVVGL